MEATKTMVEFFRGAGCGWLVVSIVWSLAYGVGVCFNSWPIGKRTLPHQKPFYRIWWWGYQLAFNISGLLIGWVMLYWLCYSTKPSEFGTPHFIGLAVAFLGITGNLPQIAMRLKA